MAQKVIAMDTRVVLALMSTEPVRVSALCAELGISRQTFYKYRRRFRAGGLAGLADRSRRPHRSPRQIRPEVEELILTWRKTLEDDGLDYGAQAIWYWMRREAGQQGPPPAVSTINRVLRRRGLARLEPAKRPRSSWRRFEYPRANDCWQIDATGWSLSDGTLAWIFTLLDDHTRLVLASHVAPAQDGVGAWTAVCRATAAELGLPGIVLSDNGTCFTGKMHDSVVAFERNLWAHAIRTVNSRPGHPQTCGKLERWHQTVQKWLVKRPRAGTLDQLQAQLDAFVELYNARRPHAALGGDTPAERWASSERGGPDPTAGPPTRILARTASAKGVIGLSPHTIGLGKDWAGVQVHVFVTGDHVSVYGNGRLARELDLDPTRRHQLLPGSPRRSSAAAKPVETEGAVHVERPQAPPKGEAEDERR
jgi:transposase InsO family protein